VTTADRREPWSPGNAAAVIDTVLGGRYRITTLIARGGMADVFAAHDDTLDRTVAVKLLRPRDDPGQFLGELLAQGRVNHEVVVRLYDAGCHDGLAYLVMEYVPGGSLRERIAEGQVPPGRCAEIGRCLAEAVDHAHRLGIVHQDIKPANVLLDDTGNVRLADFGIARLAESTRATGPDATLGTAAYLAPEQVAGEDVGPAVDIYALGLVLLEALTGRREYPGPTVEAALARLSRSPDVPTDLPDPWPPLLRAMTARDPAERPTAAEVAECLPADAAAGRETTTMVLPHQPPRSPGWRWPAVAAGAAALLLAAALLAGAPGDAGPVEEPVRDAVDEAPPAPDQDPPPAAEGPPPGNEAEGPPPESEAQPPQPAPRGEAKGLDRGRGPRR
jgi:eukaryotic-like serine/threonine-protein kinase